MTIIVSDNGSANVMDPQETEMEAASQPQPDGDRTMPHTKRNTNKGRTIVRWTDAEQEMLAKNLATMRMNQPYTAMKTLIEKAQQQLPVERRRNIFNFKKDSYRVAELFEAEMQHIRDAARRGMKDTEPPPAPPPAPPAPTSEEILEAMPDEALTYYLRERGLPLEQLLPIVSDQVATLMGNLSAVGSIIGTTASNLVGHMNDHFSKLHGRLDKLEARVGTSSQTPTYRNTQDRTGKMPRITVVGLTGGQVQDVLRACQAHAHMKFVDREKRIHVNDFPVCDWCVLMTKSIGHDMQTQAIAAYGRPKIVFVNGAVSSGIQAVIDLARRYANGETPPENK